MTRLLMTAVLAALLPFSAFAADAAAAAAPTKEIKAAPAADKAEKKAAVQAEARLHPHWGDTKIDLRHCLKHSDNKAVMSCAN